MKFPRNARIFRGQLDAAPLATVLFLLVIFLMLGGLVYTPGIHLQLPTADDLPGLDERPVAVAIDENGRLFFQNELIEEGELRSRLRQVARDASEALTLSILADKKVSSEMIIRLTLLAREAGITNAWLATLPRAFPAAGTPTGQ